MEIRNKVLAHLTTLLLFSAFGNNMQASASMPLESEHEAAAQIDEGRLFHTVARHVRPARGYFRSDSLSMERQMIAEFLSDKQGEWIASLDSETHKLSIIQSANDYLLRLQLTDANGQLVSLELKLFEQDQGFYLKTESSAGEIAGVTVQNALYPFNTNASYSQSLVFKEGNQSILIYEQEHVGNNWLSIRFNGPDSSTKFMFKKVL